MSSAESRILQETRGEPGALLDRCVMLAERVSTLAELLDSAKVYLEHFVPVEEALVNGFDIDAWCDQVERALAGLGADPATQETGAGMYEPRPGWPS